MSDEFTEEQNDDFREAFDLFDRDNDGAITFKEFVAIMRAFSQPYTELTLAEMFTEINDKDIGTINYPQFLGILEKHFKEDDHSEEAQVEEVHKAFRAFDKDGIGYIIDYELEEIMKNYGYKMSDDEVRDFLLEADIHKNGKINYQLFVNKMSTALAPLRR